MLSRLPGAQIIVASVQGQQISAEGLIFSDLARLEEIEHCDVLCVPGGASCTTPCRTRLIWKPSPY